MYNDAVMLSLTSYMLDYVARYKFLYVCIYNRCGDGDVSCIHNMLIKSITVASAGAAIREVVWMTCKKTNYNLSIKNCAKLFLTVTFLPTVKNMANGLKLCEVHSVSTSYNSAFNTVA